MYFFYVYYKFYSLDRSKKINKFSNILRDSILCLSKDKIKDRIKLEITEDSTPDMILNLNFSVKSKVRKKIMVKIIIQ